jgi:hypothetical protein
MADHDRGHRVLPLATTPRSWSCAAGQPNSLSRGNYEHDGPHLAIHEPMAMIARAWLAAGRGGKRTGGEIADKLDVSDREQLAAIVARNVAL